ncbi:hypothetical protein FNF27_07652 [Cafeteria roenbergensis]|uniref:serine C-palmitoyltransferase n=1 Tax=Cafeteria roenbergensis TaxID=33653 RepID=A0A5A8DJZ7_CAFRO|nr:hypothetical protein FNF28_04636 [Cafeteria roenbergensis]KAA0165449.1 hypothetical protein FNF27_07652 [Cafeteria roenbergensis]
MPATRSSSSARRRSTRALSPPASPGAASVPAAVLSPEEASSVSHAAAPAPAPREQAHDSEGPTAFVVLTTYFAYAMLVLMGHIRDFLGRMAGSRYRVLNGVKGYAPLLQDWENFYTRRLYHRIQDCWNRPIKGPPFSATMEVIDRRPVPRTYQLEPTEKSGKFLNLGSYNYLGFADDWVESCRGAVMKAVDQFSVSSCSSAVDIGLTSLQTELEANVAGFLGKEAAIVYSMGYGTNAASIPALMGPGTLILSDALNHASIVNGARHSGATIRVFRHNNPAHLEQLLREAIVAGQPLTRRPWRKVLVVVEGVYSMEGEIADLKPLVRVAKRYKAYVMLDEAHSIGALGKTGRGACEHCGVDTADVDVMMGTFTKSYGAMGGYIAGSKELIDYLRQNSSGSVYGTAMSPVVVAQVLRAFEIIEGRDGTDTGARKLQAIKDNANYFRSRLEDMGCELLGQKDSPVVPLMLYNPGKIAAFSRECYKRGLAVVVVGFPATSLIESRTRFCISAGHTREDLDLALERIEEVVDLLRLRYRKRWMG